MPRADFERIKVALEQAIDVLVEECTRGYCAPFDVRMEDSTVVEDIEHVTLHKMGDLLEEALYGLSTLDGLDEVIDKVRPVLSDDEMRLVIGASINGQLGELLQSMMPHPSDKANMN